MEKIGIGILVIIILAMVILVNMFLGILLLDYTSSIIGMPIQNSISNLFLVGILWVFMTAFAGAVCYLIGDVVLKVANFLKLRGVIK